MFSFGSRSRSAFTTVRPPMPESKTPMGRASLMQRESQRDAATLQLVASPFVKGRGRLACAALSGHLQTCLSLGSLSALAELSKRYDPKSVEPKWYQRWIDN